MRMPFVGIDAVDGILLLGKHLLCALYAVHIVPCSAVHTAYTYIFIFIFNTIQSARLNAVRNMH